MYTLADIATTSLTLTYLLGVFSRKTASEGNGATSNGIVDASTSEQPYQQVAEPQYGTIMPMLPVHRQNENDDSPPKDAIIYSELTASTSPK